MVTALPPPTDALAEKRVSLGLGWAQFEVVLAALGDRRTAQLAYYDGLLEVMTPLEPHENASGLLGQLIEIVTEELGLPIKTMGSTRLTRQELGSAEPDQGYYIANEPLVRGRQVNLSVDPPPDLVLEVDITHSDIDKNALYARLGVPEFWRFDGQRLVIYQLEQGAYREVGVSPSFPVVPKERIYQFLRDCREEGETAAKRALRGCLRQNRDIDV